MHQSETRSRRRGHLGEEGEGFVDVYEETFGRTIVCDLGYNLDIETNNKEETMEKNQELEYIRRAKKGDNFAKTAILKQYGSSTIFMDPQHARAPTFIPRFITLLISCQRSCASFAWTELAAALLSTTPRPPTLRTPRGPSWPRRCLRTWVMTAPASCRRTTWYPRLLRISSEQQPDQRQARLCGV